MTGTFALQASDHLQGLNYRQNDMVYLNSKRQLHVTVMPSLDVLVICRENAITCLMSRTSSNLRLSIKFIAVPHVRTKEAVANMCISETKSMIQRSRII